ncbi:MAG: hypothetical protein A2138_02210 [Deltaproteobacteria bacterium RBG_16_71_12]|nr:MAG: hypothetical protein A2138_02210 [Deltaproteobacteria bacterium RBG_16_71_12]
MRASLFRTLAISLAASAVAISVGAAVRSQHCASERDECEDIALQAFDGKRGPVICRPPMSVASSRENYRAWQEMQRRDIAVREAQLRRHRSDMAECAARADACTGD